MKFVYYASLIAGQGDSSESLAKEKQHYDVLKKSVQDLIQSQLLEISTNLIGEFIVMWPPFNSFATQFLQHLLAILFDQGIIDMNRNGNFCKGTWVSKIVAETKVDARVEQ